jgi:hypothetical protein
MNVLRAAMENLFHALDADQRAVVCLVSLMVSFPSPPFRRSGRPGPRPHFFAGGNARAQHGVVALRVAHRDGAAFGAAILDDEHDIIRPGFAPRFWEQHRARSAAAGAPAVSWKATFDRHVRQDARVQLVETDAHFDRGFCRSAVGMMAMTLQGIFQSGYASSVASTGWPGSTRLM